MPHSFFRTCGKTSSPESKQGRVAGKVPIGHYLPISTATATARSQKNLFAPVAISTSGAEGDLIDFPYQDTDRVMKYEAYLIIGTGIVLWITSAIMGASLYVVYAGTTTFGLIIAGVLAMALELTKVLSWRRGGWYRVIAIILSMLTITTVIGTSMMTIQARNDLSDTSRFVALRSSVAYREHLSQLEALKAQQTALVAKLAALPPEYVTATTRLSDQLGVIGSEIKLATDSLTTLEASITSTPGQDAPTLFTAISRLTGVDESNIEIIGLAFLAVMIEVAAFSLIGSSGSDHRGTGMPTGDNDRSIIRTKRQTSVLMASQSGTGVTQSSALPSPPTDPTADDYLRIATDHANKPILLGRSHVMARLGIKDRQARSMLQELLDTGKVRRQSKFFVANESA